MAALVIASAASCSAGCGRVGIDASGLVDGAPPGDVTPPDDVADVPVCQRSPCRAGYQAIDGGCYRLASTPRRWLDAETDCEADGGHLVVEDSVAEHEVIHDLAGPGRIWIGWTDRRSNDNIFVWVAPVAGGLLQSNPCVFGASEPDAGDADHCVAQSSPSQCPDYSDENCEIALPYICECDGNRADPSSY